MDRATIQSDKAKDEVAKLNYTLQGSFHIVWGIELGSYIVQTMNKSNSPKLKFMSDRLYILPPSWKSKKPIDSSDTRTLNQYYTPIIK